MRAFALLAVCTLPIAAHGVDFFDNFDSYAAGSQIHGQGGWKGWGNNPAAGALVSGAFAFSGANSVNITGPSDLVHEFSGATNGQWTFSVRQYVPSTSAGRSFLDLYSQYTDAGPWVSGVKTHFDMGTSLVTATVGTPATLPLIKDQWVPYRAEIDLDADMVSEYYNNALLSTHTWGGTLQAIQSVNFYANNAGPVYYDDVRLVFANAETNPPTIVNVAPAPGTVTDLTAIAVTWSEPVTGVEAADLLVNGLPATSLTGGGSSYTFYFAQPAYRTVSISWSPGHGISDLATPVNPFDAAAPGATWEYDLVDITPPVVASLHPPQGASVRALSQIEVGFSEEVSGVDAADLRINGQPATDLTHPPGFPYIFSFPQPATGTVAVAWVPAHGITDIAAVPNPFAGGGWTYLLDPNLPATDIVINEFLAANVGFTNRLDEDGEVQDWIELYNRGANAVNLENWSLSDDPALPGLWTFPARTLNPGQYLIVFASGKDRKPTATNQDLHANFSLARKGEHLGLYTPDAPRQLASGFLLYPEQRNDVSYGFDTTGALRYFAPPTPGAANGNSSIIGVVAPVHVNVPRGYFTAPFALMLSCPTPGATLRYTTNGAEPDATSAIFPSSLVVSNTRLFRAVGFKTNHLPSKTVTHTYLFNLPNHLRSLPAVSIVTATNHLWGPSGIWGIQGGSFSGPGGVWVSSSPSDYHNPQKRGPAWERPTSVEWIDPTDHSGFQADCGIRISSGDFRRPRITPTTKVSFRLYFRGDYGDSGPGYSLFPLTSVPSSDIVLRGGFDDENNPFVRDEVHRRLSHDMGQVASHGTLAVLFINGVARTVSPYYNPCERINDDFCQAYYGGGEAWDVITQYSPNGSTVDGVRTDFESLVTYVNNNNPTNQSVYTNIARWLDLTNFADYLILCTYGMMDDWPGNNYRAAREQGTNGLWRYHIWDAELSMGRNALNADLNPFTFNGVTGGLQGSSEISILYRRLKLSAEFKLLWADRVQKHFYSGGALTRANITNRVEELRLQLLPLLPTMDAEFRNWARDRWPYYFSHMQGQGLLPTNAAPNFSQHGGRVPVGFNLTMTHTNSTGSIYYTTNGGDPRVAFTGAVSGPAALYSTPVPINASVTVKARVKQSTNWSALTEATFTRTSLGSPVRISEIMYKPGGGSLYEFIELVNPTASAVNLSGYYFNGVTHIFAQGATLSAGARLVLGANTDTNAWKFRYPGVNAAGWFAGNLNNAGERLELFDAAGSLVSSVDFLDSGGWHEAAAGSGRSLEVIDPNGDPDSPANWQASAQTNGTPGSAISPAPAQTVFLNEVMAENLAAVTNAGTYPDWFELGNPADAPVSIANWSLSDDGNERKYVFPAGTTIPANGYLVVWCDAATNTTPGLHAGFSLNQDGETISLYDAGTNRIDALSLGLQLANYSVGRVNGAWTLTTPTPNATNAAAPLAAAANLAINEWMANPVPGQNDWLELFNGSATLPVSLQGLYLATSNNLHQLRALSFVRPGGHVQLHADKGVGPDRLDFNLSAAGDRIALYDNTGGLIQQISFGVQAEGVSSGRLPDGTATLTAFPGSATPGTTNYVAAYTGPVFSEVLARNTTVDVSGRIVDFIELQNTGATTFNLGGMSLSVDKSNPGAWVFPADTLLAAKAHLLIACDGSQPASTNAGNFNLGNSLDGESGGAYLFNAGGQLVHSVPYGLQIANLSIGLSGGQWRLLSAPTPGASNASPAPLGTNTALRLNEWMADEAGGADWFELYNPATQAVDLATISLSDDPSILGLGKFRPAPLSFIAAKGFVKWAADANPGQGFDHVNFALDGQGDSLLLHGVAGTNFTLLNAVAFGAQSNGVSAGRLLDGAATIIAFPGSASPAASNYRLLQNVELTEVLTHTDPPLEDAVELHNPTAAPLEIGRWYLSNLKDELRKYQIPPGTTLAPNGYAVIYEYQFNNGTTNSFTLNSAHGDEVWLSAADAGGNETGDRLVVPFGAAFNGVSFGRIATSAGVDYAPLTQRTFGVSNPATLAAFRTGTGVANAAPIVGPIILNEILYHPPGGMNGDYEFIELHNRSANLVPLYDPAYPTNRWKLGDGVGFTFPTNVSLAPGSYLLVVDFDPVANPTALTNFRAIYGVSPGVPIYGPLSGNLANDADEVGLYQPDTPQQLPSPDAGFVAYVRVDHVSYTDMFPWPTGAVDGGGLSLQRSSPALYGNEALNWVASVPTPGAGYDSDGDGIPDASELAMGLNPNNPADAALDPDLDGASNYEEYIAGTGHLNPNSRLRLNASHSGTDIGLTFEAISNKTYSVLYKNDLANPAWLKLGDLPAQPFNRTVSVTNAQTAPARFYRLATPAIQ